MENTNPVERKATDEDVWLMTVPVELLHTMVIPYLSLRDWFAMRHSCSALFKAFDNLPDFTWAKLCAESWYRNKNEKRTRQEKEKEDENEKEKGIEEELFGNGLAADVIQVGNQKLRNIIPRAYSHSVLATRNVEPYFFASWEDCYNQHREAEKKLDTLIETLKKDPVEYLSKEDAHYLCEKITKVLEEEPNLLPLDSPLVVVGDIHGHLANMLEIFKRKGWPGETTADTLFLGDYVNRGYHSIPATLLLFALKIKYPNRVHLLRGMAECESISRVGGGFYDDVMRMYANDDSLWTAMCKTFCYLPLAALIGGKIFAVHGGLSPEINEPQQINGIDRYREIDSEGAMTDLLWSDAEDAEGWLPSPRGAGYTWGPDITREFVEKNNLQLILRSHSLIVDSGYAYTHDDKVLTIFSAANYCYRCGNPGTIAIIDENLTVQVEAFDEVPELVGGTRQAVVANPGTTPYFI